MTPPPLFGAVPQPSGVRYSVWAPQNSELTVVILNAEGQRIREQPLEPTSCGFFEGIDPQGAPGDLYQIRLASGSERPDPASRWQPLGVHGPSMVIDSGQYAWGDAEWQSPPLRDWVIYELHVGTFTPEGTFRAAAEKLEYLRDLGITAVELMPVAEFPGNRNWGYDGVHPFAPSRAYGHPDDLRRFIDHAHGLGIAVILDVVYNHFGPDGNYLSEYIGEFIDESAKTPWGGAIRYGDPAFAPLRKFVVENAAYWRRDFHVDGFRLDATHAIQDESPSHLLAEVTTMLHDLGAVVIAEDNRREPRILRPVEQGGFGFDAVWADDFHHVARVRETGDRRGYFAEFEGSAHELAQAWRAGWLEAASGSPRLERFRPSSFVQCISNHDQTGNRPFGDRFHGAASPAAYRALSALLCVTPGTPLFFMGQEWAASAPFLYFTDHQPELGALVTQGRQREFAEFFAREKDGEAKVVPDPQAEATFEASKLAWEEQGQPEHAACLALYRAWLQARRLYSDLKPTAPDGWDVAVLHDNLLALRTGTLLILYALRAATVSLVANALTAPAPGHAWQPLLASNELRFGGNGEPVLDLVAQSCTFGEATTVLLSL